ncbi:MAG: HAD family phosphatase [Oscillospiraceae bacterium]|nr:HAD family phosphatase [Oscillospiraceae bacterium]
MKIRLITFDLDGTVLDDSKNIPAENIVALQTAAEKNILVVPASGRIYRFMPEAVRTQLAARYFIAANGGEVYDAAEDKVLYSAQIPLDMVLQVLDHMDSLDVLYDCYADNTRYACTSFSAHADDYFSGPLMNSMLHNYILRTMQETDDLRTFITERNRSLQKLQMYFRDSDERLRQLHMLPQLFPNLAVSTSLPNNIEINSAEATKGKALAALCSRLGIDSSEVIAFGDGLNDLDMLQFAGLSVAMGNADPLIRQNSLYVTCSNNESGVGKALRHFGII